MQRAPSFLLFIIVVFTIACDNSEPLNSRIPFVPVYLEIDLNSALNKELWVNNGYKVFSDKGYKGVIVFRQNSNLYRAFEQTCTFDPEAVCSKVVVDDSGLFLIDKCCNSTYSFDGQVTGGPAPQKLLEYPIMIDGNILYVINN